MNWKPVSELPEYNKTILLAWPEKRFAGESWWLKGHFDQDGWRDECNDPLPEPPTHWSLITPPSDAPNVQLDSIDVCPCLIADSPCKPDCSCVHEYSSAGCCCCASCGSAEQRKHAANLIVQRMQKPNVEAALAEALEELLHGYRGDPDAFPYDKVLEEQARAALALHRKAGE